MSAQAFIWDALLFMAKVELELTSDADMHLFFEKGMRVFYIPKRYSKAYNKYLKPYDPKKEPKDIMYIYISPNFFQQVDLNGWILKLLIQINMAVIVRMVVF